jgi:DNA-binding transcriptional regulator GbsR (MarR family)
MQDCANIPLEILRLKDLNAYDKIVFGRIYAFNPEDCHMELSDFADELGINKVTVVKALKKLKEMKLVQDTSYKGLKAVNIIDLFNQPKEEI